MSVGTITRQHTVWCDSCNEWLQLDERHVKSFKLEIQKFGWRKIGRKWRCLGCRIRELEQKGPR